MRRSTFVLSLLVVLGASGCSFIDDFGPFYIVDASVDAGVAGDLGVDGGGPDLGPLGTVQSLAAGNGHACALYSTGRLRCWGANEAGQLGNGVPVSVADPGTPEATPQDVLGLPGPVSSVAAGYAHTCAVVRDGGVNALYCWGSNYDQQLGIPSLEGGTSTPQRVSGLWEPKQVACGNDFTCLLTTTGRVFCAGQNASAQLGISDGTTLESAEFVPTTALLEAYAPTAIVASARNACILTAGNARCWGNNESEQLTLALSAGEAIPYATDVGAAVALGIGSYHMCAIDGADSIQCWGYGDFGQLGNNTVALVGPRADITMPLEEGGTARQHATALAVSDTYACGIFASPSAAGAVYCWGGNQAGEIGVPVSVTEAALVPIRVAALASVTQLAAGTDYACALSTDHKVFCWGSNYYRQLGPDGPGDGSATPVQVSGLD